MGGCGDNDESCRPRDHARNKEEEQGQRRKKRLLLDDQLLPSSSSDDVSTTDLRLLPADETARTSFHGAVFLFGGGFSPLPFEPSRQGGRPLILDNLSEWPFYPIQRAMRADRDRQATRADQDAKRRRLGPISD